MLSKKIEVSGLYVFYREAGREDAPKLVLLHGFPASSHQWQAFLRRNQPKTIILWGKTTSVLRVKVASRTSKTSLVRKCIG